MSIGTLAESVYAPLSGLSSRTTNRSALLFSPFRPLYEDVGRVTAEEHLVMWLWNGTAANVVLSDIAADASEMAQGISWDATPPDLIGAHESQRVVITVAGDDGPLTFTVVLSFLSSCLLGPELTITGSRAPYLSGDVGYLFFPHNWEGGLDEHLAWKTDVMIAHDRTEQRVQLRTSPRRTWDLQLLVAGDDRRRLETWLCMRKSRYQLAPIWRDAVVLSASIAPGDSIISVSDFGSDNVVSGSPVAVWAQGMTPEIRNVTGVGSNFIAVDVPFEQAWSSGATWTGPCRYCLSLEQRRVGRFTEDVADFRISLLATNDKWSPSGSEVETYRGLDVCPFTPSWEGADEGIDNKWVRLDNETGLIEFDIQSEEPVYSREIKHLFIGREAIDDALSFLSSRSGRLSPFWIAANDRGFELSAPAASGQNYLLIEPISYEYSLKGSSARSHVELITTSGTVIRRMITSVETLPSGEEKLTLDSSVPEEIAAATLNRCAWLELVRLDSDEITLHWVTGECLELTLPIVVLP